MLTDEQKKMRLTGIGGSEIGALVLPDHYAKPIDIYLAKVEGRQAEDNFHMERGRFYERPTAEWWAHRRGATLRETGTLRDPDKSIVIATPDFVGKLEDGSELDLSIKVPGPHTHASWGTPGSDEVPAYALVQVQWELIPLGKMYGITKAEVAAPLRGDLCVFVVEADHEFQAMLTDEAERFWRNHVLPKKPPPVDASSSYSDFLASRYPTHLRTFIQADDEAEGWAKELKEARELKAAAEEREALARNNLIAKIADAEGVQGAGWRISYKATKGREVVDWKSVCTSASIPKSLIEQHTSRSPFRQFRFTAGSKDE